MTFSDAKLRRTIVCTPVVADFGLAIAMQATRTSGGASTKGGRGTMQYKAPEHFTGDSDSDDSDEETKSSQYTIIIQRAFRKTLIRKEQSSIDDGSLYAPRPPFPPPPGNINKTDKNRKFLWVKIGKIYWKT